MPVTYDGKALIPAPFVSVSKEHQTTEDGTPIGTSYSVSVKGKLLPNRGSPDSTGAFWDQAGYPPDEAVAHDSRMGALLRKQAALRALFGEQGRPFEVAPLDGSPPMRFSPRVLRVDFPEGVWVDQCDYSISLECDRMEGEVEEFPGRISRASESWDIESIDEDLGTYRLTHAVSAVGKRVHDEAGALTAEAWENAKAYAVSRLGLVPARMSAPDVLSNEGLRAYNYVRSQKISETAGSFEVSETWACHDPAGGAAATHQSQVETRFSLQDNKTTVSVGGTIAGMKVSDNETSAVISTKWANAQAKWEEVTPSLLARAQALSGVTLNPAPAATSLGRNDVSGVITYSYDYDTRPGSTVAGAVSERVAVSDSNPADVFAVVLGPGMALGPVLQSVGAVTERKRTISVQVQMPPKSYAYSPARPDVAALILDHRPAGSVVYLASDEETWDENAGDYSRTVGYTWQA